VMELQQGILVLMGAAMIVSAVVAMYTEDLVSSVIAVGVVSLFASILYLLLQAPDVAMTEAAIGAGLSTLIFLYALKKTRDTEEEND
jgi:energy-converting hydrogenase B subunit D